MHRTAMLDLRLLLIESLEGILAAKSFSHQNFGGIAPLFIVYSIVGKLDLSSYYFVGILLSFETVYFTLCIWLLTFHETSLCKSSFCF